MYTPVNVAKLLTPHALIHTDSLGEKEIHCKWPENFFVSEKHNHLQSSIRSHNQGYECILQQQ